MLESLGDGARMRRGRAYARKGQVKSIDLQPGLVSARVESSRPVPYDVQIKIAPLSDAHWEQTFEALASQAIFTPQLLGNEMPSIVEDVFQAAGVALLPRRGDVEMNCSCPDWANPCKHIAAVCYLLAEAADGDPFQTFTLRGRTREQVMGALREQRAATAGADEHLAPKELPEPLEDGAADFWTPRESLEDFEVTIKPPTLDTALLKRLGPPSFVHRPEAYLAALTLACHSVTDRALALAFKENQSEES